MVAVLVTYDLNSPGQKYEELYKLIEEFGTRAKLMESTWIVIGTSAQSVFDKLSAVADSGDKIFCVEISGKSRQGLLPKETWEWIRKHV